MVVPAGAVPSQVVVTHRSACWVVSGPSVVVAMMRPRSLNQRSSQRTSVGVVPVAGRVSMRPW